MKRLFLLFFSALLCTAVSAHDFEVDGIYYNITSSSELAVSVTFRGDEYNSYYNEYSGSVVIPEKVTYNSKEYSVTSIGDYAFRDCSGLTSVTIGNSVTRIGYYVFYGCSGLTSVTIPNSVTSIGSGAFRDCSGLTAVHITDLSAWCKIKFYDYGSNPTEYAHHLYLNGEEITNLVIPDDITSIGDYAFYGCSGLTSVTIPNSVTSIGREAFRGCYGLTSVTIPNSVTSIGDGAFNGCSGLTSVTIGNSVTRIGEYAFHGCLGLTSVTIPNSVTSIGDYAFYGCSGLTSVTIPNSVTSIGERTFCNCWSLTNIYIPESVTRISQEAFSDCSRITRIDCMAATPPLVYNKTFSSSIYSKAIIYVPLESIDLYKSADYWKEFTTIRHSGYVEVKSISFDKATVEIEEGGTMNLAVTISPEDATDKTISWKSSDETIATVNDGVVTAIKPGNATITATSLCTPAVTATCKIVVTKKYVSVTGIALDKTKAEMAEGETLKLTATISPDDATDKTITWTSSDETVATVDNGIVRAIRPGKAIITVKAGTVSATCEVTVKETINIYMSASSVNLYPDTQFDFSISMNNDVEISAFQCDIYIPEGVTLQKNSKGKYDITLNTERSDDHTISTALQPDGSVRVVAVSMTSAPLFGTEGPLFYLNLLAGEELGQYTIDVKNISVSDVAGNLYNLPDVSGTVEVYYKPGDANGDGSVAVNDAVLAVNKILGAESEEFKFRAADMNGDGNILVNDVVLIVNTILGTSTTTAALAPRHINAFETLSVADIRTAYGMTEFGITLSNASRYTAMQFDMELADGADIADIKVSMPTDHSVAYRRMDDTTVRVVVTSLTNEALAEGAQLSISMKDAAGKTVAFTNGRAACNNGQMVGIMPGSTVLGGTTGIDGVNAEFAPADVYSIDGRIVKKNATTLDGLKPGVYVINGRKVVVER